MIDCSDITFILSSRNDGYACVSKDWQEEQKKKIETCIYSSQKTFPNSKFILVDYCPPENNKKLSELFTEYKNIKFITIDKKLKDELNADNKNNIKINFYEFLAKHIGSLYCETEYIIFINQDIIFPLKNREILISSLRNGETNIAYRCQIEYNLINLKIPELYNLCNSIFSPQILKKDIYGNGDFLAIKKEKYEKIGGYLLCHQNWAVDNEILYRLGLEELESVSMKKGTINKIKRNYEILSLNHPEDPSGALRKRGEDYEPISSKFLNNLKDYVVDIIEC